MELQFLTEDIKVFLQMYNETHMIKHRQEGQIYIL